MNSFNVHAWISNLGVKSLKLNCSLDGSCVLLTNYKNDWKNIV